MNLDSDTSAHLDPAILAALTAGEDESRIDYDAVLARVFERLDKAEALGPLAAIKMEETPPLSYWDDLERRIGDRVKDYREYDQPVAECIAGDVALTDTAAVRVETGLNRLTEAAEGQPAWEQMLRSDEVLPEGDWERVADRIATRIDQAPRARSAIAWPLLAAHWLGRPVTAAITAACVIALAAGGTWIALRERPEPVFVYQTSGGIGSIPAGASSVRQFVTGPHAAMTLVNKHGFVRLTNGANLRVDGVSRTSAAYRLDLAAAGNSSGAEFFFNRAAPHASYRVDVQGFVIEVTGTYFTVRADSLAVTTEVFEGSVRLRSAHGEPVLVAAGQSCAIDRASGRWSLISGGLTVARDSIETTPPPEVLARSVACAFSALDPTRPCEMSIDGKRVGYLPAVVLLMPGAYGVSLRGADGGAADSIVRIDARSPNVFVFSLPEAAPDRIADTRATTGGVRTAPAESPAVESWIAEEKMSYARADSLMKAARVLGRGRWQRAAEAYRQVLAGPASGTQRQNALFALGAVYADYAFDKKRAREQFASYRAQYPAGIFAGEVLLRLAELSVPDQRDSAIAYYRRYLQVASGSLRTGEVRYQLGLLLLQAGQRDAALEELEQALIEAHDTTAGLKRLVAQTLSRVLDEQRQTERAAEIRRRYLSDAVNR